MNRRGVTIIEVMVVLLILAILMTLLLPAIQYARQSANRTNCSSNIRQLLIAHNAYYESKGRFTKEWARDLLQKGSAFDPKLEAPAEFRCPSSTILRDEATGFGLTTYGQNPCLYGEDRRIIRDGESITVLHGEFVSDEEAVWTKSPILNGANCQSDHGAGANYGMVDGSVHYFTTDFDAKLRDKLLLPSDGEIFNLP